MLNQGKVRSHYGAPSKSLTHLPPKAPLFASNSAQIDSFTGTHNGLTRSSSHGAGYEKFDNDSEIIPATEPSWLNELLDSPKVSQRRFSHRRSASDTVAFLEAPINLTKIGGIAEEEEFISPSRKPPVRLRGSLDFDRLDEEQIVNMFSHLELFENPSVEAKNLFSQARQAPITRFSRSMIESCTPELRNLSPDFDSSTSASKNYCVQDVFHEDMKVVRGRYMNGRPELEGAGVVKNYDESFKNGDHLQSNLDVEADRELHQTKRQSAQRSRVRKLQYIAELERRVHVLQTEVSTLSPQVAYLDHQRSLLSADNKALKQRISALINDKQFKDAHIEIMKKERHRLRLLLFQQKSHVLPHLQQASTSKLHPGLLQDEETAPAVTDAFVRLVKASSMAPNIQVGVTKSWASRKTSTVKSGMPSSCTLAGNGKNLEAAILSSDFMVQNP
ncbi:hypothetical protein O6H91_11G037700 [Diphasiastrum complanatum]|uniref:Uncharacterized protein n=1 Tax=Diphasiastrum complanatum TaxID=34168 RepID=A0ACC2C840_DIPCM|nr:hypothetical protein O6H91_11G037700 [Diphasiastrum complanatum]